MVIVGTVLSILAVGVAIVLAKKNKMHALLDMFNKEKEKINVNKELIKENLKKTRKDNSELEDKEKRLERELNELDKNDGTVDYKSTGDLSDEEILKEFRKKEKEYFDN